MSTQPATQPERPSADSPSSLRDSVAPSLITTPQLRMLHALAKRRGLTHEDLRDVAGVGSLKDLTRAEAARVIDRLDADRPEPPRRRARTRAANVIRQASIYQVNMLCALAHDLGWESERRDGWLHKRHGIASLAARLFSSRTASEAITQLQQALRKHAAATGGRFKASRDGTYDYQPGPARSGQPPSSTE